MSLRCSIGLHSWDGCKCAICGKTRNDQHHLADDCGKCSKCGKIFEEDMHSWSEDCNKCARCGKTRENHHHWLKDCEKCSECGKARKDHHQMVNGLCQVCGHGTFMDENSGRSYKVIKIGNQIMMAENYCKKPEKGNAWAYEDTEENIEKYGYLYDWDTAKSLSPKGWHLPTKEDWESLHAFLGGDDKKVYEQLKVGGNSGFDGLFGGLRTTHKAFNSLGASAQFWSDSSENDKQIWYFKLGAYSSIAKLEKGEPGLGMSLRFFKDKN